MEGESFIKLFFDFLSYLEYLLKEGKINHHEFFGLSDRYLKIYMKEYGENEDYIEMRKRMLDSWRTIKPKKKRNVEYSRKDLFLPHIDILPPPPKPIDSNWFNPYHN